MVVRATIIASTMFLLQMKMFEGRTSSPPCCRDMLGPTTCQRLLRNNEHYFAERCNKDAEFRLIQCCTTCNKFGRAMAYDLVARSLVSEQCFDRYGKQFCARYVNSTDVWSPMYWSCEGQNPHIAFRSCRESCGFCDFKVVNYTIDNALKSCRVDREGWRRKMTLGNIRRLTHRDSRIH